MLNIDESENKRPYSIDEKIEILRKTNRKLFCTPNVVDRARNALKTASKEYKDRLADLESVYERNEYYLLGLLQKDIKQVWILTAKLKELLDQLETVRKQLEESESESAMEILSDEERTKLERRAEELQRKATDTKEQLESSAVDSAD